LIFSFLWKKGYTGIRFFYQSTDILSGKSDKISCFGLSLLCFQIPRDETQNHRNDQYQRRPRSFSLALALPIIFVAPAPLAVLPSPIPRLAETAFFVVVFKVREATTGIEVPLAKEVLKKKKDKKGEHDNVQHSCKFLEMKKVVLGFFDCDESSTRILFAISTPIQQFILVYSFSTSYKKPIYSNSDFFNLNPDFLSAMPSKQSARKTNRPPQANAAGGGFET
jgi:hypothetical protein